MEIIAAPFRQFKTVSLIVTLVLLASSTGLVMMQELQNTELMSSSMAATIVSLLTALAAGARFVKQNISITADDKIDLVAAAAAQPLKDGEKKVAVNINNVPVPSKPKETPK